MKLDVGDYRLKEFPDCCVVERKGSAAELYRNLFDRKDMRRQGRALQKLVSRVKHPYLLVEAGPARVLNGRPLPGHEVDPQQMLERLTRVVSRYGLGLLWFSAGTTSHTRRLVGNCVLSLMLSHAIEDNYLN